MHCLHGIFISGSHGHNFKKSVHFAENENTCKHRLDDFRIQKHTLQHAEIWCSRSGRPATGKSGLGTSKESGLNLVPIIN